MTEKKTDQELVDAFKKDYEKLCKKHGLMFVPAANLKQSMDTGEYTIIAVNQIMKLPENPNDNGQEK